jgi:hypothetical protein
MTDAEIEQRAAGEAFLRGYHDIPDDEKLRQMSFVELAALLSSCENGSARYLVVEQEMFRRRNGNSAEVPNPSAAPSTDVADSKNEWHEKPLGKVWLTVVGGILLALALYLLKTHIGLPL